MALSGTGQNDSSGLIVQPARRDEPRRRDGEEMKKKKKTTGVVRKRPTSRLSRISSKSVWSASREGSGPTATLQRSKSLPVISPPPPAGPLCTTACTTSATRRATCPTHPRRRTMPAKSSPTRSLSKVKPLVRKRAPGSRPGGSAINTLRRAASHVGPDRTGITFFPKPIFSDERSSLLSFLTASFGKSDDRPPGSGPTSWGVTRPNATPREVADPQRRPTLGTVAPPVYTTVALESRTTHPEGFSRSPSDGRPSTTYPSGPSAHEGLWDDEEARRTRSGSGPISPTGGLSRRDSVAVEQLTSQLEKATAPPPHGGPGPTEHVRSLSFHVGNEPSWRHTFQQRLEARLSRLTGREPPSRAPPGRAAECQHRVQTYQPASDFGMNFWPPVRAPASTTDGPRRSGSTSSTPVQTGQASNGRPVPADRESRGAHPGGGARRSPFSVVAARPRRESSAGPAPLAHGTGDAHRTEDARSTSDDAPLPHQFDFEWSERAQAEGGGPRSTEPWSPLDRRRVPTSLH